MHEEGDHATKNQLSGSRIQGDGLEKRLEQWECILHDQHGRLLPQRLANGQLPHHHFAQIRRKEGTPRPHTSQKSANFKNPKEGEWPGDEVARGSELCSWFLAGVKNQKQSLTLRQEARERRIISKCETFHRNPAGSQSRPAEPGQQPEASLAWGWVTITAKRRQRDQTLCD